MTLFLLIPAALAVWFMIFRTTQSALLNVYVPTLLLFPLYFQWRLKGLPPLDPTQAVMLVFFVFILLRHRRELYFSSTDVWVLIFVYGIGISEMLHSGLRSGIFVLFNDFVSALLPYYIGKLFIEQYGMRTAMLKRLCFLLFLVAFASAYEYRMTINPYHTYLGPYFPGQADTWIIQMRWGRARASGPYGHAIIAGMMFLSGVILNFWLVRTKKWEPNFRFLVLPYIRKSVLITLGLLFGIYATQSRGPWLGVLFGFAVALIGLAHNTKIAFIRFIIGATLIFSFAYPFVQDYTSIKVPGLVQDPEQQDAVYRRQLIDNYTPVVEAGGFWGWGSNFPVVKNQYSIDNEYLLLGITRGYLGLSVFILLAGDAIFTLTRTGIRFRSRDDRLFAFCMIGVLAGVLFAITTVYLGYQMFDLFFLLMGWSQAIGRKKPEPFPAFEKVYV